MFAGKFKQKQRKKQRKRSQFFFDLIKFENPSRNFVFVFIVEIVIGRSEMIRCRFLCKGKVIFFEHIHYLMSFMNVNCGYKSDQNIQFGNIFVFS